MQLTKEGIPEDKSSIKDLHQHAFQVHDNRHMMPKKNTSHAVVRTTHSVKALIQDLAKANGHAQLSVAILSVATLRPHYVLMLPEGRVPSLEAPENMMCTLEISYFFVRSVDSLKQSHLHALDDPCVDVAR